MGILGLFSKKQKEDLDQGLEKTKENFFSKVSRAVAGKTTVDDAVLDELEGALVEADVGLETTVKIIERLEARVAKDKYLGTAELHRLLKEEIIELIDQDKSSDEQVVAGLQVIMVVGVNGVGKTTTIGKLAKQFKDQGKKVMLGAADTFRAAAIDQLAVWAERADVPIIKKEMGSDPASVAFDAVSAAKAQGVDVVIIDTAGRLHNKVGLMNELGKIKNVMRKVIDEAPHEVMLVLDASTGQNAVLQAREFTAVTDVTAIALTKLDGTAKGGVVLGIADQFSIPVKYIGVGEQIDQLQPFIAGEFIDSLFADRS
jgi:fused signal recognition particle receptor